MRLTIVLIVIAIVYGGLWYWHRRQQAKKVLHKIADDLKDAKAGVNYERIDPHGKRI